MNKTTVCQVFQIQQFCDLLRGQVANQLGTILLKNHGEFGSNSEG